MIGDSQNDILTARNSGMWALGVTYGFSPDSLKSPAPDVLIDSPQELARSAGLRLNAASLWKSRLARALPAKLEFAESRFARSAVT